METSIRTFSGQHPYRPAHLVEAIRADVKIMEQKYPEEGPIDIDAVAAAAELTEEIDNGWCPRCKGSLPIPPEVPSGSRITQCRCIPVCAMCGQHEALYGTPGDPTNFLSVGGIVWFGPWEWVNDPPDSESVAADVKFATARMTSGVLDVPGGVLVTDDGVAVVTPEQPRTGGWAQHGDDGEEQDAEERRGR